MYQSAISCFFFLTTGKRLRMKVLFSSSGYVHSSLFFKIAFGIDLAIQIDIVRLGAISRGCFENDPAHGC
jgi:hypothetical protein